MKTKKALAVIVLVVIVIAGLYYLSAKNKVVSTPTPEVSAADWKTYTNEEFGFQITLNDDWKGYKVETSGSDNGGEPCVVAGINHCATGISFEVPILEKNYGDHSGYATPFSIDIYPKNMWDKLMQESGPKPDLLAQNDNYVFGLTTWQDHPTELENKDLLSPVSTFKLIKTMKVTIMVPTDLEKYGQVMANFPSPETSAHWPFEKKEVEVLYNSDIIQASINGVMNTFPSQDPNTKVSYTVKNDTAYVSIKIDGWAGVSIYLNGLEPILSKTLLQFPEIKKVVFSFGPR